MKCAYDFRRIAREALRGKWMIAVVAGLIAGLLGGTSSSGPKLELKISDSGRNVTFGAGGQQIFSTADSWTGILHGGIGSLLIGGAVVIVLAALVLGAVYFILGSVIRLGYARFNLDLIDGQKEPELGSLFGYFSHWKTAALAKFLQALRVFLWSLLFIIPGIMSSYSYVMTGYILAECPELTAQEALLQSKEMMYGNRWRLFCLHFSFIGWSLLAALTLGIGNLWLNPYREAAEAAFYRELAGRENAGESMESEFV